MKLKNKIFTALCAGAITLNQLSYIWAIPKALERFPSDGEIIIKDHEISQLYDMERELEVRDYINLANSLVHRRKMRYQVCRHTTFATYNTFKLLAERNRRKDLLDKVIMAANYLGPFDGEFSAHIWLKIYENGEWQDYETLFPTPRLNENNVREYSKKTRAERSELQIENKRAKFLTRPNNREFYPTLDAFNPANGGLSYALSRIITIRIGSRT